MLEWKNSVLKDNPPLCNYKAVPADLSKPDWTEKLEQAGFNKKLPTLWITAGFLGYLPAEGVHNFLEKVNELSAKGSLYTADISTGLMNENPMVKKLAQILEDNGSPIQFACDKPEDLFSQHGFKKVVKVTNFPELADSLKVKLFDEVIPQDYKTFASRSVLIVVKKE